MMNFTIALTGNPCYHTGSTASAPGALLWLMPFLEQGPTSAHLHDLYYEW